MVSKTQDLFSHELLPKYWSTLHRLQITPPLPSKAVRSPVVGSLRRAAKPRYDGKNGFGLKRASEREGERKREGDSFAADVFSTPFVNTGKLI